SRAGRRILRDCPGVQWTILESILFIAVENAIQHSRQDNRFSFEIVILITEGTVAIRIDNRIFKTLPLAIRDKKFVPPVRLIEIDRSEKDTERGQAGKAIHLLSRYINQLIDTEDPAAQPSVSWHQIKEHGSLEKVRFELRIPLRPQAGSAPAASSIFSSSAVSDNLAQVVRKLETFGIKIGAARPGFSVVPDNVEWVMDEVRPVEGNTIITEFDRLPVAKVAASIDKSLQINFLGLNCRGVFLGVQDLGDRYRPVAVKMFNFPLTRRHQFEYYMKEFIAVQVYERLGIGPRFYGIIKNRQGDVLGYAMQLVIGEYNKLEWVEGFQSYYKRYFNAELDTLRLWAFAAGLNLTDECMETRKHRLVAIDAVNRWVIRDEARFRTFMQGGLGEREELIRRSSGEYYRHANTPFITWAGNLASVKNDVLEVDANGTAPLSFEIVLEDKKKPFLPETLIEQLKLQAFLRYVANGRPWPKKPNEIRLRNLHVTQTKSPNSSYTVSGTLCIPPRIHLLRGNIRLTTRVGQERWLESGPDENNWSFTVQRNETASSPRASTALAQLAGAKKEEVLEAAGRALGYRASSSLSAFPAERMQSYRNIKGVVAALAVPLIAISLSWYFGPYYIAAVNSSIITSLLLMSAVGGVGRGCGMYINQSLRDERVDWNKVARWAVFGGLYLGLVVFGAWYWFLTRYVESTLLKVALDVTLFAAVIGLPSNFLIHKYLVSRNREPIRFRDTYRDFSRLFVFNALFWASGLALGWQFWPEYIVLIAANMGIVWSGILIYLLDTWLKRGSTPAQNTNANTVEKICALTEEGREYYQGRDQPGFPGQKSSSPFHILLVEDDVALAATLKGVFESKGYEVSVCDRADAGLELLRHMPSLVITDLNLRGGKGAGVKVLAAARARKIPSILLTADSQAVETRRAEFEKLGVRMILLKPVSVKAALDAVKQASSSPVGRASYPLPAKYRQLSGVVEELHKRGMDVKSERRQPLQDSINIVLVWEAGVRSSEHALRFIYLSEFARRLKNTKIILAAPEHLQVIATERVVLVHRGLMFNGLEVFPVQFTPPIAGHALLHPHEFQTRLNVLRECIPLWPSGESYFLNGSKNFQQKLLEREGILHPRSFEVVDGNERHIDEIVRGFSKTGTSREAKIFIKPDAGAEGEGAAVFSYDPKTPRKEYARQIAALVRGATSAKRLCCQEFIESIPVDTENFTDAWFVSSTEVPPQVRNTVRAVVVKNANGTWGVYSKTVRLGWPFISAQTTFAHLFFDTFCSRIHFPGLGKLSFDKQQQLGRKIDDIAARVARVVSSQREYSRDLLFAVDFIVSDEPDSDGLPKCYVIEYGTAFLHACIIDRLIGARGRKIHGVAYKDSMNDYRYLEVFLDAVHSQAREYASFLKARPNAVFNVWKDAQLHSRAPSPKSSSAAGNPANFHSFPNTAFGAGDLMRRHHQADLIIAAFPKKIIKRGDAYKKKPGEEDLAVNETSPHAEKIRQAIEVLKTLRPKSQINKDIVARACRFEKETTVIEVEVPSHFLLYGTENVSVYYQVTHIGKENKIIYVPAMFLDDVEEGRYIATILHHDQMEIEEYSRILERGQPVTYEAVEAAHARAMKIDPFGVYTRIARRCQRMMAVSDMFTVALARTQRVRLRARITEQEGQLQKSRAQGLTIQKGAPRARDILFDIARLHIQLACLYDIENSHKKAVGSYQAAIEALNVIKTDADVDTGFLPIQIQARVIYILARQKMLTALRKEFRDFSRLRVGREVSGPEKQAFLMYMYDNFSRVKREVIEILQRHRVHAAGDRRSGTEEIRFAETIRFIERCIYQPEAAASSSAAVGDEPGLEQRINIPDEAWRGFDEAAWGRAWTEWASRQQQGQKRFFDESFQTPGLQAGSASSAGGKILYEETEVLNRMLLRAIEERQLSALIADVGRSIGVQAYLVGGMRYLLYGTRKDIDIAIVARGRAKEFFQAFIERLNQEGIPTRELFSYSIAKGENPPELSGQFIMGVKRRPLTCDIFSYDTLQTLAQGTLTGIVARCKQKDSSWAPLYADSIRKGYIHLEYYFGDASLHAEAASFYRRRLTSRLDALMRQRLEALLSAVAATPQEKLHETIITVLDGRATPQSSSCLVGAGTASSATENGKGAPDVVARRRERVEPLPRLARPLHKRLQQLLKHKQVLWLKDEKVNVEDLDDPDARFILHLGRDVTHSFLPKALFFVFNKTAVGRGISQQMGKKVYVFPIDLGRSHQEIKGRLAGILEQAKAHPQVICLTATKPVKDLIAAKEFRGIWKDWQSEPEGLTSANVIFLRRTEEGVIAHAANTDGKAFLSAYKMHWALGGNLGQKVEVAAATERRVSLRGKKVVVLGFGGAGQAIAQALAQEKMHKPLRISISHRSASFENAKTIFKELCCASHLTGSIASIVPGNRPQQAAPDLELIETEDARDSPLLLSRLKEADIIINATAAGMNGQAQAAIKDIEAVFESRKNKPIVIDIIHRSEGGKPLVTYLLKIAHYHAHAPVYNGLTMWYA
ncbi:MAG: response regulator, partial [Candidatus Omnitrophica bacterium]|nr:response regulator [Candidatus Omnitrophota bacterium]